MKRQTLTVDQYLELQESYTFKDLQFDSVNCYDDNDGLFEELVDNVTNETVLDINNTGGQF